MAINYNDLVGCGVAFGDKTVSWPYSVGIVTIGIFQDHNGIQTTSIIPPENIDYISSDSMIALVTVDGIIIPEATGEATIHISVKNRTDIDVWIYCSILQGFPIGFSMGCLGLTYSDG